VGWTKPEFDKPEVDKAGKVLLWSHDQIWRAPEAYSHALRVVNNWRSSHSFPLNTFQATLRRRARKFDQRAVVVQRLKRLPSIEGKLSRQSTRLTQMQDIGGCRAIVQNVNQVSRLVQVYKLSDTKNPTRGATKRHEFVRRARLHCESKD
jgi:ppGpp synthetase/RelA/SpoT-type nucleotidyltranferase